MPLSEKVKSASQSILIKSITLISGTWTMNKDCTIYLSSSSFFVPSSLDHPKMLCFLFSDKVSEIKVRGLILVLWLADCSFSLKAWQSLSECSIFSLFCDTIVLFVTNLSSCPFVVCFTQEYISSFQNFAASFNRLC